MDARAHLRGLGWRGDGFSLDAADRGLAKPLLITHRVDGRGLGRKAHREKQADRWWFNAFDAALQSLGSLDTPDAVECSALAQVQRDGFTRGGGLYGFFRKGETLSGTLPVAAETQLVPKVTAEKINRNQKLRNIPKLQKSNIELSESKIELSISKKKLAKYLLKAQMKNMSIEEYVQRKKAKKQRRKTKVK